MIYLEETIYIWANKPFENTVGVEGLSKIEFQKRFVIKESLTTKNSILLLTESSTSKSVDSLWFHL